MSLLRPHRHPAGRHPRSWRLPWIALVVSIAATSATDGATVARHQPRQTGTASTQVDTRADALEEARRLREEAQRLTAAQQYKEASERAERALTLRVTHLGEMHADVAELIALLGRLAYSQGDYGRAETRFRDALRIREAIFGSEHLTVAESLNELASMLQLRGDYVTPEPLYQRALAMCERVSANPQTPASTAQQLTAEVLNNLALLSQRRGDFDGAEARYLRVLAIRERLNGPDDPAVARAAANLGGTYYVSGQYAKAIEVLERALAIQERHVPPNDRSLATSNFNLAAVYFDLGDYPQAEVLFSRALAIEEQTAADKGDPRLAVRLLGLAEVLRLQGAYARAEPLYERALKIREHGLGATHPLVAETLIARGLLRLAAGDAAGAVGWLSRGAAVREDNVALVLPSGSEEEKRRYLQLLVDETDMAVSVHLTGAPTSTAAATLALTTVLQRKGRSIDAMADAFAAIRRRLNDGDRQMLLQITDAQRKLAGLVLNRVATDEQRTAVAALRNDIHRLEADVSARSAAFRVVSRQATVGSITQGLPVGGVLLEYFSYRPFFVRNRRATAFGAPHYAVYALRTDGTVAGVDLGDAALIEQHIRRFRAALANPADRRVREAARTVYETIIEPIQAAIGSATRLFVSPDGALNLIPFAALVDRQNNYLVEQYAISYVTSGRDLLRVADGRTDDGRALEPPMVIANPSFEGRSVTSGRSADSPTMTRTIDVRTLEPLRHFAALPATAQEARALLNILPDARVYTGTAATEAVVKAARAPSILHIATHGFFLSPGTRPTAPTSDRQTSSASAAGKAAPKDGRDDALVLSGLAFAGANQRRSGDGEDGILTALEAAGLDLWGTRLVVLSACETGVGEARNGEGVYGLRRALVLAGSESQVMSLWRVSDTATKDLMIGYYRRLQSGEGRADALRSVQLAMLHGGRTRVHPFYWAGFIQSGDWRVLH